MPYTDVYQLTHVIAGAADYWKDRTPDRTTGWFGFRIPVVLTADHSLLRQPRRAPDLSRLASDTDEVEGWRICLDGTEAEAFRDFMERTGALFQELKLPNNDWRFLDIAVGYLTKAFFEDGLEQLLWHITALEAVFGESKRGVTERLARRLASILGSSEEEKKDLPAPPVASGVDDAVRGRPDERALSETFAGFRGALAQCITQRDSLPRCHSTERSLTDGACATTNHRLIKTSRSNGGPLDARGSQP
jgi:hypothetical protein